MKFRVALVLLLLTACAPQKVWYKEGASNQDFGMDMGQCKAQAFGISNPTLFQIAVVQNQCMFGKGWNLIDKEQ